MPDLEIAIIPCLKDNYAYLVRSGELCAVIDPAEAAPVPVAEKKTTAVPFNKDDFKNDPLIQKALEVFKARIVDVRA